MCDSADFFILCIMFKKGLLGLLLLSFSGFADDPPVLKGSVKDSAGEVYIQGATVAIYNKDGRQVHPTVLTDAAQRFEIDNLRAGVYIVKADFAGFQTKQKEVNLSQGKKEEINIELTKEE